jgi:hypothetical protein
MAIASRLLDFLFHDHPSNSNTTTSAAIGQYTPSRHLPRASSSNMALPNAHTSDTAARVDVVVPTQRDIPTDGALATSSNAPSRHLPSASSSNMALPDVHMAGATADTDLGVLTQLDVSTATALATGSDALEHSPLGRLPRELRDEIYTMVSTQPHGLVCKYTSWDPSYNGGQVSQALNIRATCKQIRAETEGMFFVLNDISFDLLHYRCGANRPNPYREVGGKQNVQMVNAIPPSLLSPSTKAIIWVDPACADSGDVPQICRIAQSVQHGNVFLGARLGNPRWASSGIEHYLFHVPRFPNLFDELVCIKDVPVSPNDCAGFGIVFPFKDRAGALALLEDQYKKKMALIEVHTTHRFCAVRAKREILIQSLGLVREKLLNFVTTTFEALETMKQ